MRIVDRISDALEQGNIFYSFEYFPPKTDSGVENLYDRVLRMKEMNPMFVDMTWGAGGSTADLSLDISISIQNLVGIECQMHLTCTNMPKQKIDDALAKCKEAGIRNILALRGDPPHGEERWTAVEGGFEHACDLVRYIRANYGDYFGIAVAGYPEGHLEATNYEDDLAHLKEKVDAGADVIITQLFYDCDIFLKFVEDCRALGINVPIIPGIMPLMNYNSFRRMTGFCKTKIPEEIEAELEPIKDDDEAVKEYGVQLGVRMCKYLLAHGVRGLHFYTLNLEKTVSQILEGLDLIPRDQRKRLPWKPAGTHRRGSEDVRPIFWSNRPSSYLARTAHWDEFPNGRWGDSRSPAYGEIELHYLCSAFRADFDKTLWGEPVSADDVQQVFVSFLEGKISAMPWHLVPVSSETSLIDNVLVRLNKSGFWTINSQPGVNGSPSEDPVVGWGPSGGFVYQKPYLEFFCSPEKFSQLYERLRDHPSITFHAVSNKGESFQNSSGVNAVTWGVFPNREVLQPTIVDPASFVAWKDEAFELWERGWANIYPDGSKSRDILLDIQNSYFLVNIVENNYVHGNIFSIFDGLLVD